MFIPTEHFKIRFKERFQLDYTDGVGRTLQQSIINKNSRKIDCRIYNNHKHFIFYNNKLFNDPIIFSISDDGYFITCINTNIKDKIFN